MAGLCGVCFFVDFRCEGATEDFGACAPGGVASRGFSSPSLVLFFPMVLMCARQ